MADQHSKKLESQKEEALMMGSLTCIPFEHFFVDTTALPFSGSFDVAQPIGINGTDFALRQRGQEEQEKDCPSIAAFLDVYSLHNLSLTCKRARYYLPFSQKFLVPIQKISRETGEGIKETLCWQHIWGNSCQFFPLSKLQLKFLGSTALLEPEEMQEKVAKIRELALHPLQTDIMALTATTRHPDGDEVSCVSSRSVLWYRVPSVFRKTKLPILRMEQKYRGMLRLAAPSINPVIENIPLLQGEARKFCRADYSFYPEGFFRQDTAAEPYTATEVELLPKAVACLTGRVLELAVAIAESPYMIKNFLEVDEKYFALFFRAKYPRFTKQNLQFVLMAKEASGFSTKVKAIQELFELFPSFTIRAKQSADVGRQAVNVQVAYDLPIDLRLLDTILDNAKKKELLFDFVKAMVVSLSEEIEMSAFEANFVIQYFKDPDARRSTPNIFPISEIIANCRGRGELHSRCLGGCDAGCSWQHKQQQVNLVVEKANALMQLLAICDYDVSDLKVNPEEPDNIIHMLQARDACFQETHQQLDNVSANLDVLIQELQATVSCISDYPSIFGTLEQPTEPLLFQRQQRQYQRGQGKAMGLTSRRVGRRLS